MSRFPAAVVFDLDDTLADERALIDEAVAEVATSAAALRPLDPAALGRDIVEEARRLWWAHPDHPWARSVGVASWEALWARFEGPDPRVERYRAWAPRYRADAWTAALARQGIADDALGPDLAARFIAARRARCRVDPEAAPLLDLLRSRGVRLGLVTNGLSCLQREKLAATGLAERLDAIVVSGDVGVGKPDPRPLATVLERLGIAPRDAALVGNSVEKDVACAAAAGVRSIWLDRLGRPDVEDGPEPDATVRRLADVPAALSAS